MKNKETNIWVELINLKTMKKFKLYFECEFDRDKYIRRSKYFKTIKIIDYDDYYKMYYSMSERDI